MRAALDVEPVAVSVDSVLDQRQALLRSAQSRITHDVNTDHSVSHVIIAKVPDRGGTSGIAVGRTVQEEEEEASIIYHLSVCLSVTALHLFFVRVTCDVCTARSCIGRMTVFRPCG